MIPHRPLAVVGAALALSACTASRPAGALPPAAEPHAQQCAADRAQAFVGRPASRVLGEAARNAAGARILRTITPGMMVTMDYVPDRLNLVIDKRGRISAIRCG